MWSVRLPSDDVAWGVRDINVLIVLNACVPRKLLLIFLNIHLFKAPAKLTKIHLLVWLKGIYSQVWNCELWNFRQFCHLYLLVFNFILYWNYWLFMSFFFLLLWSLFFLFWKLLIDIEPQGISVDFLINNVVIQASYFVFSVFEIIFLCERIELFMNLFLSGVVIVQCLNILIFFL